VIKSLITAASLMSNTNVQFTATFGGDTYIDIYGHHMGMFGLSGVSLPFSCDNTSNISGIEYVIRYYETHNVVATGLPVDITLGATRSFRAYLVSVQGNLANAETLQWTFNMKFALIPYSRPNKSLTNQPGTTTAGPSATPPVTPPVQPTDAELFPLRTAGPLTPAQVPGISTPSKGPNLDLISWR
jgi:hypothetical protein